MSRPVIFDETAQDTYLALIASGVPLGDAATKLGISRRTPNQLKTRDRAFAQRLSAAKTAGTAARRAAPRPLIHGRPGTYNHHKCRCTPCTTAASHARSNAPDRKHATIHPLPAPQPPADPAKFPVLADVV
ncbi:hypothetical protein [Streptomyces lydicus]|uniref:hypothetical protein n=1 Tax=Streptomyces lydicus TaxID=47763 RepID=UPI0037B9DC3B